LILFTFLILTGFLSVRIFFIGIKYGISRKSELLMEAILFVLCVMEKVRYNVIVTDKIGVTGRYGRRYYKPKGDL